MPSLLAGTIDSSVMPVSDSLLKPVYGRLHTRLLSSSFYLISDEAILS